MMLNCKPLKSHVAPPVLLTRTAPVVVVSVGADHATVTGFTVVSAVIVNDSAADCGGAIEMPHVSLSVVMAIWTIMSAGLFSEPAACAGMAASREPVSAQAVAIA
ncbi:hypothetical protein, partial [Enterobacter ludwigii]|uniref:hypothetical protein n=1 Tax=Enterobacter ludwigii TaxID=299767 RepID=UPI003F723DF8